jgi:hypothetical protein
MQRRRVTMGLLLGAGAVMGCGAKAGSNSDKGTSSLAGGANGDGGAEAAGACATGAPLSGAAYDVSRSRFAFGGTPTKETSGSFVRWVGRQGAVAIFADGSEIGSMNAGAPASDLGDWSADPTALAAHTRDYWVGMGAASCQIAGSSSVSTAMGGGSADGGITTVSPGATTIILVRGVEGIRISESLAAARFDVDDQTTDESFYWPAIPADVVSAAVAFRDRLADAASLAAYKAKLPANARGDGEVVIHHTSASSSSPFRAAAVYETTTAGDFPANLEFDENGNPVDTGW